MNSLPSSRTLALLTSGLCFWLVVSAFTILWLDGETIFVAFALLAFTAVIAVLGRGRISGWFAAILSILLFILVLAALKGFSAAVVVPAAVFALLDLITAALGMAIARKINQVDRFLKQQMKMVEELRAFEPGTGLLRASYMQTTLRTEIIRSQRFNKNLSVLLMDIENADEIERDFGKAGIEENRKRLADLLTASLRAIDVPFGGTRIGVILPETGADGGSNVVDRLVNAAQERSRLALNIGLAEFPKDGLTEKELLQAAEAAFQHARDNHLSLARYSQLEKSERGL